MKHPSDEQRQSMANLQLDIRFQRFLEWLSENESEQNALLLRAATNPDVSEQEIRGYGARSEILSEISKQCANAHEELRAMKGMNDGTL